MKKIAVFLMLVLPILAFSQNPECHLQGGDDAIAQNAISNFKSTPVVKGFRVCLFNGSNQEARNEAKQTLEMLYATYPMIVGGIIYDAPIFKVLAGACVTKIEATQLLNKLKITFPKAFIISSNIPISDFVYQGKKTDSENLEEPKEIEEL